MKTISYCIACYNEFENIPVLYDEILKLLDSLNSYNHEIIFEDNASTDGTQDILREIARKDMRVKVILNTRNFGPLRSSRNCMFAATGDFIINLAADMQTPIALVPTFVWYWEEGYKVILGQKTDTKEKRLAKTLRTAYYRIIAIFSDVPEYENVTGFGGFDSVVIKMLRTSGDTDTSFRHLLAEFGYEAKLIPYIHQKRLHGKSSYSLAKHFDFSITSLINTSRAPLRLATVIGLSGSVISFIIGCIYLIMKLVNWGDISSGIAPLLIGMFFIGSLQLFFLGIIGEYTGSIFLRLSSRPLVVEKERINFPE
jgi:glycosyltransferase involved in cell wall biosynthesis